VRLLEILCQLCDMENEKEKKVVVTLRKRKIIVCFKSDTSVSDKAVLGK